MEHREEAIRQAGEAGLNRLWTHTVGIANTIRDVGFDPLTRRRGDEETMGTGCAARWGNHSFILTAGHVPHEDAQPRDLRLYWRPVGKLEKRPTDEVLREDVMDAVPIADPKAALHRCRWADLALITISPEYAGAYTEFFDIAKEWIDPPEGDPVHCCGFQLDRGFLFDRKSIGDWEERSIGLSPFVFDGVVLPLPTETQLRFTITAFDPEIHYLIPFADAEKGFSPKGYSGGATWWESDKMPIIWAPTFKFAGICSVSYEKGAKEQVIKASAVRRFLEEVFGPAV
jgi:hypothetical protein